MDGRRDLRRSVAQNSRSPGSIWPSAILFGMAAYWSAAVRGISTPACANAHWVRPEQSQLSGPARAVHVGLPDLGLGGLNGQERDPADAPGVDETDGSRGAPGGGQCRCVTRGGLGGNLGLELLFQRDNLGLRTLKRRLLFGKRVLRIGGRVRRLGRQLILLVCASSRLERSPPRPLAALLRPWPARRCRRRKRLGRCASPTGVAPDSCHSTRLRRDR